MTSDVESRPGRPPSEETRRAILDATMTLLGEEGYDRLTMDAIAERAGASKATIYRHWQGKPDLVVDAVRGHTNHIPEASTGNLRDDLMASLSGLIESLRETPAGACIATLLEASRRDEQLRELADPFVASKRAAGKALFQAAIERGELRPDTDLDLITDMFIGPIIYRHVALRETPGLDYAAMVVDRVVGAFAVEDSEKA